MLDQQCWAQHTVVFLKFVYLYREVAETETASETLMVCMIMKLQQQWHFIPDHFVASQSCHLICLAQTHPRRLHIITDSDCHPFDSIVRGITDLLIHYYYTFAI